jgi:hypothetical protein
MIRIDKRLFDMALRRDQVMINRVLDELKFERVEGDDDFYYLKLDQGGQMLSGWWTDYSYFVREGHEEEAREMGTVLPIYGGIRGFQLEPEFGDVADRLMEVWAQLAPRQILTESYYGEGNFAIKADDYFRYYFERTGRRYVDDLPNNLIQAYGVLEARFNEEAEE